MTRNISARPGTSLCVIYTGSFDPDSQANRVIPNTIQQSGAWKQWKPRHCMPSHESTDVSLARVAPTLFLGSG